MNNILINLNSLLNHF